MKNRSERGVALILVLILVLVLSVMAASLMFLSQTETWSSLNYRLMTQARYGAEAGAQKAANYLLNNYTAPTAAVINSTYVTNATNVLYPASTGNSVGVTYGGNPVVLSANSSVSSNYPDGTIQTAFNSAANGTLTAGNTTVSYTAYAVLVSMWSVTQYNSATPTTVQTWRITGDATVSGVENSQEEVSTILETQVVPFFSYAAFATSAGCGALSFGGGGSTESYDSSLYTSSGGTNLGVLAADGNVGTNGNLSTVGNPTVINGNLSTPKAGVGTCSNGNVTAWTNSSGHVTGSIVELPASVTYPDPVIPASASGTNSYNSSVTLPGGNYGDISLSGHGVITLGNTCSPSPCTPAVATYNVNTLSAAGNNTGVIIQGPVIINVCGATVAGGTCGSVNHTTGATTGSTGTVFDITGNSITNASLISNYCVINYAGAGVVNLKGGSQAAGLLYAPNASYSFASANAAWYGAVIGAALTDQGHTTIYYDRHLSTAGVMVTSPTLGSFTWKRY